MNGDDVLLKIALAGLSVLWAILVIILVAAGNYVFRTLSELKDELAAIRAELGAIKAVDDYRREQKMRDRLS